SPRWASDDVLPRVGVADVPENSVARAGRAVDDDRPLVLRAHQVCFTPRQYRERKTEWEWQYVHRVLLSAPAVAGHAPPSRAAPRASIRRGRRDGSRVAAILRAASATASSPMPATACRSRWSASTKAATFMCGTVTSL